MGFHVAANASVGLSLSQNGGNGLPPGIEDYRHPLPESRIERRHFLRQIVQLAAASYIRGPNGDTLNSADQSIDRVFAALKRAHPLAVDVGGDDLFDDGVPQGFLAVEVVVQCALGDSGYGQNRVQAGALEPRSVDLAGCRLQQALPRALRIAQPGRSRPRTLSRTLFRTLFRTAFRTLLRIRACCQHTNQYVC